MPTDQKTPLRVSLQPDAGKIPFASLNVIRGTGIAVVEKRAAVEFVKPTHNTKGANTDQQHDTHTCNMKRENEETIIRTEPETTCGPQALYGQTLSGERYCPGQAI